MELIVAAVLLVSSLALIAIGGTRGPDSLATGIGAIGVFGTFGGLLLWLYVESAFSGKVFVSSRFGSRIVDPSQDYATALIGGIFTLGLALFLLAIAVIMVIGIVKRFTSRER